MKAETKNQKQRGQLAHINATRPAGHPSDRLNSQAVRSLNRILANEFGLFTKTLNFHWNVTGPHFHSLHEFLEEQYKDILELMDGAAERVRSLGGRPVSTLQEVEEHMSVTERPGDYPETEKMLTELLEAHYRIQDLVKTDLSEIKAWEEDPGTEDFLINLLKSHEKMSWMIKSHLD